MANQVTYSNIFSEARDNIVSIISTNVDDPVTTSSQHRKWIYSRYPDTKASDFKGFPIIVVHPADTDIEERGTLDMKSKYVSWSIEIEIITSDRGYGLKDGQGLSHMDSVSDSVISTLMSKTNRKTLSQNSMKFTTPTTTAVVVEDIDNTKIYRRSIMVDCKSRIQISA
jgi:hypothetical protein